MIVWTKGRMDLRLDRKPFILLKHDGFGMPPSPRIESSAPLQHGTIDRGVKLPARNITLYIGLFADSWEHYYQLRETLLYYFAPDGITGFLTVIEGGYTRRIYGHAVAGLEFKDADRSFQTHIVPVVIHCPNPLWQNNMYSYIAIDAGGSTDVGSVPTTVPFTVGTSMMNETSVVAYRGSFESYPEMIDIYGAITDPVLRNNATGAILDFTGTTIAADDHYTIELGYGKNKVYDSAFVNRIDRLSANSNMTGFKFIPNENNSITVTGSSITGTTGVYMLWYDRFFGI